MYVPYGNKAAFETAELWKDFKDIIEVRDIVFADSNVKDICVAHWDTNNDGELSYEEAAAVTSLESANFSINSFSFNELRYFTGITSIKNSFTNNYVTSIIIPVNVTSIGMQAFYGCSHLTSIIIPNGVTSIEHAAFSGCI